MGDSAGLLPGGKGRDVKTLSNSDKYGELKYMYLFDGLIWVSSVLIRMGGNRKQQNDALCWI